MPELYEVDLEDTPAYPARGFRVLYPLYSDEAKWGAWRQLRRYLPAKTVIEGISWTAARPGIWELAIGLGRFGAEKPITLTSLIINDQSECNELHKVLFMVNPSWEKGSGLCARVRAITGKGEVKVRAHYVEVV